MEDTIITTYYLCDEFLKATEHRDDPQVRLSTAEVMTVALVGAAFFGGNIEATRSFLEDYGYIEKAISKSRFNRSASSGAGFTRARSMERRSVAT